MSTGVFDGEMTARRSIDCYVPRVVLRRLGTAPNEPVQTVEGTIVFVDLSGFTKLSERLARRGREGAEHVTDTINSCFTVLLAEAYANGGSMLKFGGDALLLWFEGPEHAPRACASAVEMRRTLRRVGRIRVGASEIVLRMSVGVHSGDYSMFLVGASHWEFLVSGPAVTTVVAMEAAASAGEILLSPATADLLPARCRGQARGPGVLLARAPEPAPWTEEEATPLPPEAAVAACLSTAVRAHVTAGEVPPEHRTAVVTFLQYGGMDALLAEHGEAEAAVALDELVRTAQAAADRYDVCFLGSDIAPDGGKLLFSAGAPRAVGDEAERMLLAMRQIIEAGGRLPVRVGINRGYTFTGLVGPTYRRTYVVMGDVTNLAARLSAKARWGGILATLPVLTGSKSRFATEAVPPFLVKGKRKPIEACDVGPALAGPGSEARAERLPLIGRAAERGRLEQALAGAREGRGVVVGIEGEPGVGKTRLVAEVADDVVDMRRIHITCAGYTQAIPYFFTRELIRQLLDPASDADTVSLDRLRARMERTTPQLIPFLPLLAVAAGVTTDSTPMVDGLAPEYRARKLLEVMLDFLEPELEVPTLVVIEHAHRIDEASVAILDALIERALGRSPWVVFATRRDTRGGLYPKGQYAVRIPLEPLASDAMLELAEATAEAHIVPPHMLQLAVERAAGNPEFLLDLLAAAAAGSGTLPDTVETAASARIDAFDPGDRQLIRRASLLGLRFRPDRLVHVMPAGAPLPSDETWRRLRGVFVMDPDGRVRFTRPPLREAAYAGLPFRLRRELHETVGLALELDAGHDLDADPALLSLHFALAGDCGRAWRYAKEGAEHATELCAHADAARLYRRALEAGRDAGASPAELARVSEALGEALRQAGERRAAEAAYTAARRMFLGSPVDEARLCYRHAVAAERSGSMVAAVRWTNRGLRLVEGREEEAARRIRAQMLSALAGFRERQSRLREAELACRQAIAEGEAVGELRALAHACYVLDHVLVRAGRLDEATHSARALAIYRDLGDAERESAVLNNLGGFAYERGDWDEAIELYRRQAEASERAGNPADLAFTDVNLGEILSDQGYLERADEHLRRGRRVWSSTEDALMRAFADAQLGRLAMRAGRYAESVITLRETAERMRQLGAGGYADLAEAFLAEAEAFGGDPAEALLVTDGLLRNPAGETPLIRRVRGIAYARLGLLESAASEFETSLRLGSELSAHYDLAATLDAMGRVLGVTAQQAAERDRIVARLRIAAMPTPMYESGVGNGVPHPVAAAAPLPAV